MLWILVVLGATAAAVLVGAAVVFVVDYAKDEDPGEGGADRGG
jgi:hypothetical protein